MNPLKIFLAATACFSGFLASAQANIIVFTLPNSPAFFGPTYTQDGFSFTNSGTQTNNEYVNYLSLGRPAYNADGIIADIAQNNPGSSNTIQSASSGPFSFQSIGLASELNDASGGQVRFDFNYIGGGSSSQTIALTSGVFGLQKFNFSQKNLSSVVFTATTTEGSEIQFNDVGVNGTPTIPEPSDWVLLLVGFGLLGATRRVAARHPDRLEPVL